MTTVREVLKCLVLASLCALLVAGTVALQRLPQIVNRQADETRAAVLAEFHVAIADANQRITDLSDVLDRRSAYALRTVNAVALSADQRTGEALDIVRDVAVNANLQATALRDNLNGQLTALNQTAVMALTPFDDLARRYTIPDREVKGLVDETMGVLGATKVTMGQAAVTAKAIAAEAPKMTAHVDSVAKSVEREADQLTKPQSFWGALRSWLLTLARMYGAL